MSQKIFLTSMLAIGVVAPAIAEPTYTSDTFPSTGLMQEDYTYKNAATADNMDDVYEGTVNAVAEYDIVDYILSAGQYLPKDSETPTTCPAGSYCAGGETFQYSATADQGITTCPTGYALSADGASSANECYRTCTTSDVEHSTGVSGGYYYGNNNQCEPTACVNGWHLKEGLNLADTIGNTEAENGVYINASGSFGQFTNNSAVAGATDHDQTFYGLTNNNTWAVYYGDKGMVVGQARCSTRNVANPWYNQDGYTFESDHFVSSLTDETGQDGAIYCYCNVTGYTPDGGTLQSLSSSWMYSAYHGGDASFCANNCANFCADDMRSTSPNYLAFRAALLGAVPSSAAMCEANTITINWSNADAEDISANNAGTATYGSDVRTPVKANTYKGKTFKGWRFSNPEQTNLSE